MEEQTKETMIQGINKFLFWCWNYEPVRCEIDGEYYPDAIMKVKWSCNLLHIIDKWKTTLRKAHDETDLACIRFFSELDRTNRRLMLDWVVNNYNGESKI